MANSNNIINILKIILMIIGAIFIGLLLSFSMNNLLTLWLSFKSSWLRPPYLYFIINAIIVTIAASSRLHPPPAAPSPPLRGPSHYYNAVQVTPADASDDVIGSSSSCEMASVKDVEVDEVEEREKRVVELEIVAGDQSGESTVTECATWIVPRPLDASMDQLALSETEVVASRIDHKANSQGTKLSRVAKPRQQYEYETLESVWKAITEDKQKPPTRHTRKKSEDTWRNKNRQINLLDELTPSIKKSETFKDRTNNYSPPPWRVPASSKLKNEPLLSQDELNQRIEEFINKFNENMRLQRQESLQQFMEKINRAI